MHPPQGSHASPPWRPPSTTTRRPPPAAAAAIGEGTTTTMTTRREGVATCESTTGHRRTRIRARTRRPSDDLPPHPPRSSLPPPPPSPRATSTSSMRARARLELEPPRRPRRAATTLRTSRGRRGGVGTARRPSTGGRPTDRTRRIQSRGGISSDADDYFVVLLAVALVGGRWARRRWWSLFGGRSVC